MDDSRATYERVGGQFGARDVRHRGVALGHRLHRLRMRQHTNHCIDQVLILSQSNDVLNVVFEPFDGCVTEVSSTVCDNTEGA